MDRKTKKIIWFFVRFGIAAAFILFVFWRGDVRLDVFSSKSIRWIYIIIGFLLSGTRKKKKQKNDNNTE